MARSGWPEIALPDKIFLGDAIDRLGAMLFGKAWSTSDATAMRFIGFIGDRTANHNSIADIKRVRNSLFFDRLFSIDGTNRGFDTDYYKNRYAYPESEDYDIIDDYDGSEAPRDYSNLFSEEAWAEMEAHADDLQKTQSEKCHRWETVRKKIAEYLLHGKIKYYLANPNTGAMEAGDPLLFNTPSWKSPFVKCSITLGDTYEDICEYCIFLNESEFNALPEMLGRSRDAKSEEWHPQEAEIDCKGWWNRTAVLKEASRRASLCHGRRSQQKDVAAALATMWEDVTGKEMSPESLKVYLSEANSRSRDKG